MAVDTAAVGRARPFGWARAGDLLLAAAFALLAIPTAMTLARESWSTETGAQGPIVIATGAWLIWRAKEELQRDASPGNPILLALGLVAALACYVIGRAFDFTTAEAFGLYGVGLAIAYSRFGLRAMAKSWFPFLYLGLAVPPPAYLLDRVTAPLKEFVSHAATGMLSAVGLPIAREGVTIFVAQYQLLVEDACSGMNSIIGITALTLLYVYLMRGTSFRYSAVLLACALPIAVAANILRIITLILMTYFGGDELAQGFLHMTAGMFIFALALLLVFATDALLRRIAVRAGWMT